MQYEKNQPEERRLSRADAELLDRLLAGEPLAEVVGADEPNRAEHVSRLLSLLDQWEAGEAEPGLAERAVTGVLAANPSTLSMEDGQALDALLDLRRQGVADGPMPAGVRERAVGVREVLEVLDLAEGEPVPTGLAERTMQAIEKDRQARQQRSVMAGMHLGSDRQGSISIRQIATTAALIVMSLSILLPMLNNAHRDAMIAQCSSNLAGLGGDLQKIAFDYKGETHRAAQPESDTLNPLARFARSGLDGSTIPASRAGYFVLLDEQRVSAEHRYCPTGTSSDPTAIYNGQNPAAGGPFRMFLEARPIFADTNPLYAVTPEGLVRQPDVPILTRSANHEGKGQNVLISDGSVEWMIRPAVQRGADTNDNIWVFQPEDDAEANDDIFLTP
ncbi:MAG: hypothetical protein AAF085_00905 [Planctomycetota bacterium]